MHFIATIKVNNAVLACLKIAAIGGSISATAALLAGLAVPEATSPLETLRRDLRVISAASSAASSAILDDMSEQGTLASLTVFPLPLYWASIGYQSTGRMSACGSGKTLTIVVCGNAKEEAMQSWEWRRETIRREGIELNSALGYRPCCEYPSLDLDWSPVSPDQLVALGYGWML